MGTLGDIIDRIKSGKMPVTIEYSTIKFRDHRFCCHIARSNYISLNKKTTQWLIITRLQSKTSSRIAAVNSKDFTATTTTTVVGPDAEVTVTLAASTEKSQADLTSITSVTGAILTDTTTGTYICHNRTYHQ